MLREFVEMLKAANNRYDINQMKIDAYTENVIGQFGIDLKRAELKVLQESGTNDDLIYLREEAEDGALAKAKKAIDKIIENFKNFVHEIQLKIMVLIQKKETKETIDQVEKKIRFNPFLAKKKVDVVNTKEQLSAVAWANAQLQKLLSKIRGGKEVSPDEVTEVADEFDKKMSKAGAVSNAVKMTLADAVKKLKEVGNKMVDSIESAKKTTSNLIEDAKAMSEKLFASVTGAINRIASAASNFGKAAVNTIVNAWKELIATIKSACTGIKEKLSGSNDDDNNVTESYDDHEFDELDGLLESVWGVLGESSDDDVDDIGANKEMLASVKLLKTTCVKSIRAAYKAYRSGDVKEAKERLAQAKKDFAEAHDKYRSILTDGSLGETILGSLLVAWVDCISAILAALISLPVGGLAGAIVTWYNGVKELYENITSWVNDIKNDNFTVQSFNAARNRAESAFRDTAKAIDKLDTLINNQQSAAVKKESVDSEFDLDAELDDLLSLDF